MALIGLVASRTRVPDQGASCVPSGGDSMLSREDSLRLAEMERQLWQDDPDFCSRMTGGGSRLPQQHTHRRNSLSLSLL
ncbi:MAG: DUF3040 domain-containing protein, partial [Actinoplanes sp.]